MKLADYEPLSKAALRLGISTGLARRWCRLGKLKAEKVGGVWLVERGAEPSVTRRKKEETNG